MGKEFVMVWGKCKKKPVQKLAKRNNQLRSLRLTRKMVSVVDHGFANETRLRRFVFLGLSRFVFFNCANHLLVWSLQVSNWVPEWQATSLFEIQAIRRYKQPPGILGEFNGFHFDC